MKEMKIDVYGRVQGVLFRNMTKEFCDKRNLKGYVRNRDDGSVSIVAQGDEKELRNLISWIGSSPGLSKVVDFGSENLGISKKYENFSLDFEDNILVDKSKAIFNLGKYILKKEEMKVPEHVAIIPDGNRRWAREKGLRESVGHYRAGNYGNVEAIFSKGRSMGVKYMSIWGFSTENWNRPPREIKAVFDVVMKNVERFRKDAHKNKMRFRHIGRKDRLPRKLVSELKKLEKETEKYNEFNVQLCLDYGGRDEMIRTVNKLLKLGVKKVSEEDFVKHLDSFGIPDPDLIIRTSGESRLSGFMSFQSDYAELYFMDKYFPDFSPDDLKKAVVEYGNRVRRFGGVNKKDLVRK